MSVEVALAAWEGLLSASPHGCRIHVGGGEPFGRWPALIELARRAEAAGLGPLAAVETNAFWATDARVVRERVAALDEAGMGRLTISADPYHQEFVGIERVRLAARVAREVLGAERVRVRWREWAAEGFDTDSLSEGERRAVFSQWSRRRRDRLAVPRSEPFAPGDFEDGGDEVDDMASAMPKLSAARDALGPVYNQRRGDAAFVNPSLVAAERSIGRGRPSRTKAKVG